jgi:nitroreductase
MVEMEKRRSIRKYKSIPVEESKLEAMINSALLAPSGDNTQPWRFIVVDDADVKRKVAQAAHKQGWMETAPVFIVCVADIRSRIKGTEEIDLDEETPLFELKQIIRDTAIAVDHMALEAVHQGLGTCWVSWYKQNEIRPTLGIPKDKYVLSVLTVGYSDEDPKPRPRRPASELVRRNTW